jgi:hypothetical protein
MDSSLLSNIQKLFSERIEIFSAVQFTRVSVVTGIVKIALKVTNTMYRRHPAAYFTVFVCSDIVGMCQSQDVREIWPSTDAS